MKLFIQRGDLRGVDKEFLRVIHPEREYTVELRETKRSIHKRKKQKPCTTKKVK